MPRLTPTEQIDAKIHHVTDEITNLENELTALRAVESIVHQDHAEETPAPASPPLQTAPAQRRKSKGKTARSQRHR